MMPRLPRAGWLAAGAIAAALTSGGGPFAVPLPAWVTLLAATVAVAGGAVAMRLRRSTLAAFLLAFGSVGARASVGLLLAGTAVTAAPLPVGSGDWQAVVVDVSSPNGAEQRAFIDIVAAGREQHAWRVYAWLPRHPALVPGDEIMVRGSLDGPPQGAPGFAGFLQSRGAVGTLKGHTLTLTATGNGFTASVERLRWGVDRALVTRDPGAGGRPRGRHPHRPARAREPRRERRVHHTGLTHVVAISGWNIALVAGIIGGLLRRGRAGPPGPHRCSSSSRSWPTRCPGGRQASVVRAALMGGASSSRARSGRPGTASAALGVAVLGAPARRAMMVDGRRVAAVRGGDGGPAGARGHAESAVGGLARRAGLPELARETLGVSLAAQLATLPLVLLHFGRLSLISPLANLLVAPVVPLAMLGAAIGVVAGPLLSLPWASLLMAPLLVASWVPLALMTRGAALLAGVPLANLELPAPMGLLGGALAAVALAAALRASSRRSAAAHIPRPWQPPPPATPAGHRRRMRLTAVAAGAVLAAAVSLVLVARPLPRVRGQRSGRRPGRRHPPAGVRWQPPAGGRPA